MTFKCLLYFRSLTVKNNHLTKIFQLPISLGHLDFSENLLEEIPTTDVWPTMNALLSLDLSRNRLGDNLQDGSFENLLTLRILNLQANNITKPPWQALGSLSSLQYLYLQVRQKKFLWGNPFLSLGISNLPDFYRRKYFRIIT